MDLSEHVLTMQTAAKRVYDLFLAGKLREAQEECNRCGNGAVDAWKWLQERRDGQK